MPALIVIRRHVTTSQAVTQCAYVESSLTDAAYFASPVKFGKDGVEEVLPFGQLRHGEDRQLWRTIFCLEGLKACLKACLKAWGCSRDLLGDTTKVPMLPHPLSRDHRLVHDCIA